MAFEPVSSLFHQFRCRKMLANPSGKVDRDSAKSNFNGIGHHANVCEMSCNSTKSGPKRSQTGAVCDYGKQSLTRPFKMVLIRMNSDYELGRSAFTYLLTDVTYSICQDSIDVYFTVSHSELQKIEKSTSGKAL